VTTGSQYSLNKSWTFQHKRFIFGRSLFESFIIHVWQPTKYPNNRSTPVIPSQFREQCLHLTKRYFGSAPKTHNTRYIGGDQAAAHQTRKNLNQRYRTEIWVSSRFHNGRLFPLLLYIRSEVSPGPIIPEQGGGAFYARLLNMAFIQQWRGLDIMLTQEVP
jgi:hypothetical protein